MKANPQYQRTPMKVGARSFAIDPLLREELEAHYRALGVEILPCPQNPNPQQAKPKGSRR